MVTLLERLRSLFPEASGRSLRQWLEHGRVEVNGSAVGDGRTAVEAGDRITLRYRGAAPFPPLLGFVHEDGDLLVIDKPPGLLTIAAEHERERTAYRLVWDYLRAGRPPRRPFVVHRLDKETSGLLVVAKSVPAKRHLQAQFESRDVERGYVALVEGRVRRDRGTLESRLVQDRGLRVRAGPSGRLAITHYEVRERRRDTTLLALHLGTGRRHQIRVQLADLGHPVLGDAVHGSRRNPFGRMCLHASRLGFIHPGSGARVRFESTPPLAWV
ncbi:MAG: RluA family pseudouridine synthase [Candidatus Rokuibacteriota bacterium]|nr:MAG: RluA family pseudouridine synthase [Candidatus Rokubacteria bacterium]